MSTFLRKIRLDSQKAVRNYALAGGEKLGSISLFRGGNLGLLQLLSPSVSKTRLHPGEGGKITHIARGRSKEEEIP